jgi:hypothetical protein
MRCAFCRCQSELQLLPTLQRTNLMPRFAPSLCTTPCSAGGVKECCKEPKQGSIRHLLVPPPAPPECVQAVHNIAALAFPLQEATVLSRAVKEHERRGGDKEGFSEAPGDCLAYKYYRDVGLLLFAILSAVLMPSFHACSGRRPCLHTIHWLSHL